MDSDGDNSFSSSHNISVKSFTEEQGDENKAMETEDHIETNNVSREDLPPSPKTPLKMNNTSTPMIVFSEQKSFIKGELYKETPIQVQHRLDFSHSTVTSYTPKTGNKTGLGDKSVSNTPRSRYLTPSSSAFKANELNDTNKTPASFGVVRAPSTPTPNRKNISVHLIDLTTPDVFHTPSGGASASNASRPKTLLKSALKNQSAIGGTPKTSTVGSTVKVQKLHTILNQSQTDSVATPKSDSARKAKGNDSVVASKRLMTPRTVHASPNVANKSNLTLKIVDKSFGTPATEKKIGSKPTLSTTYSSPYARKVVMTASASVSASAKKRASESIKGR